MKISTKTGVVISAIVLAALSRLIPHPMNFTPIAAIAMFGAAYLERKSIAFIIPILSIYLSNLVIDNVMYQHDSFVWMAPSFPWVAGSLVLISLMSQFTLNKVSAGRVLGSSLAASVIFFIISNFGMWQGSGIYSHDMTGLVMCYNAAIPFFGWTVAGDLVYTTAMFGGFALMQSRLPRLAAA
ncbi:MAG: hypothetical protein EP332_13020 [Bacteroidetes bacterium]|nr:MAG: hypothetical protein EP332_13020 [Bacteroidota bacterium]